jgi:long-chain acyl-CoA synthetase
MSNLGTYLERSVADYGEHPFLFFYDQTLSYADFGARVDALAAGLTSLGFKRGDFIHVWVLNSPETLVCYFAIQKIGAIAGPINGLWKADEVTYLLNDSGGRGLIVGPEYAPLLDDIRPRCPQLEQVIELSDKPRPEHHAWKAVISQGGQSLSCPAEPNDPAYIFYTSGTTGNPKGVLLSHRNVLADIESFQAAMALRQPYRILVFLPLFHVNAMMTATSTLARGGAVILRKQFSAGEFWPVVEQYEANFFSAVPAVYNILLSAPDRASHERSSLQFGICGAAPMPVETFRAFEETFNVPIVEGYGLTEGTCVSTLNPVQGERKIGSIGLPCPGQEVLIVDDEGQEVPVGERGEIVIGGDVVMLGYHNRPEETAEALAGGRLHTGDVGYKDGDGYIFIVDRLKDLVIRGGENIYPKEIDYLLVEHPKIKDAACVGVPDDIQGEEVCAYVIVHEGQELTPEEIRQYCAEHLAKFKVPKYVKILDQDFPRNAVGKILKKEMRNWPL